MKKTGLICAVLAVVVVLGGALTAGLLWRSGRREVTGEAGRKSWKEIRESADDWETGYENIDRMNELTEEARAGGKGEKAEEVLAVYEQLLEDYDRLNTGYSISYVLSYSDVNNEELSTEEEEKYMEMVDWGDAAALALKNLLNSPYREVMEDVMAEETIEDCLDYEELTDRERELMDQRSKLITDYNRLLVQEYSITEDGKEWTAESLRAFIQESWDFETYLRLQHELERVKNEALSGIYLDIVRINVELAAIAGYDNYLDYSFTEVYDRDYTAAELDMMFDEVSEYAVPFDMQLQQLYYSLDWEKVDSLNSEPEVILDAIEPHMGDISEELLQNFRDMRKYELLDNEAYEGKGAGGFTADLAAYNEAFIFYQPEGSYNDYTTVIHEFGHFNQAMVNDEPGFLEEVSLDLAEVHSTGLWLLFCKYNNDMFGREAGEAISVLNMFDAVHSGIIYQSVITEFEMEVYQNPELTVPELNRLFGRLRGKYQMDNGMGMPDTVYEENYTWVDIPHIYESPLYCVSYLTSALASLNLYTWSQSDREAAEAAYLELVHMPNEAGFSETIDTVGLGDIFETGAVKNIMEEAAASISDN